MLSKAPTGKLGKRMTAGLWLGQVQSDAFVEVKKGQNIHNECSTALGSDVDHLGIQVHNSLKVGTEEDWKAVAYLFSLAKVLLKRRYSWNVMLQLNKMLATLEVWYADMVITL